MANHGDFVTPPPLPEAQSSRLAVVWAGNPEWTYRNLSVDNTKPVDSAVDIAITTDKATVVMPLSPGQARELAHELIIRADMIDPKAGA